MRRSHLLAVAFAFALWACSAPLPTSPDVASVAGNGAVTASPDAVSTSLPSFCDRKDGSNNNNNNKPSVDHQNKDSDDCGTKGDADRRPILHRSDNRDDGDWKKGGDDAQNCTSSGTGGGSATPGSIAGTVTSDVGPIAGWSIYLIASSGTVTTTQTNASGAYSFANLQPGTYRVCEANPSPAFEALPGAATVNSTTCASPYASYGYSLTVTSGASLSGNNFQNAAAS